MKGYNMAKLLPECEGPTAGANVDRVIGKGLSTLILLDTPIRAAQVIADEEAQGCSEPRAI